MSFSSFATWSSDNTKVTNAAMPAATTSYLVLDVNPSRKALYLYNNSSNTAYVTLGPTSNSSTPAFIIPTFQYVFLTGPTMWIGQISAIRNAGSGAGFSMVATELL